MGLFCATASSRFTDARDNDRRARHTQNKAPRRGVTRMANTTTHSVTAELERARTDYLAVSRGAHLYSSPMDHEEAERRAWERLELALAAAQAVEQQTAGSA